MQQNFSKVDQPTFTSIRYLEHQTVNNVSMYFNVVEPWSRFALKIFFVLIVGPEIQNWGNFPLTFLAGSNFHQASASFSASFISRL